MARVTYRAAAAPLREDSLTISAVPAGSPPHTPASIRIELPDLEALSFIQSCREADNTRIACGTRARVLLINFLARQPIDCDIAAGGISNRPRVTACRVQNTDLGEWLVRQGIAREKTGQRYVSAAQDAQAAHRGMWVDAATRSRLLVAQAAPAPQAR